MYEGHTTLYLATQLLFILQAVLVVVVLVVVVLVVVVLALTNQQLMQLEGSAMMCCCNGLLLPCQLLNTFSKWHSKPGCNCAAQHMQLSLEVSTLKQQTLAAFSQRNHFGNS